MNLIIYFRHYLCMYLVANYTQPWRITKMCPRFNMQYFDVGNVVFNTPYIMDYSKRFYLTVIPSSSEMFEIHK